MDIYTAANDITNSGSTTYFTTVLNNTLGMFDCFDPTTKTIHCCVNTAEFIPPACHTGFGSYNT